MHITDLDDKIIRNAARDGVSVQQYTAKYEKAFLEDAAMIGIEHPRLVRATEHIPQMAEFVARLVEKGIAYRTDDGSYYFRIAKFPRYGKLSKKDFSGMLDGARVDVDEYDKDSARDFALWKAPKPGEAFWETSIGTGRPQAFVDSISADFGPIPQSAELYIRRTEAGRGLGGTIAEFPSATDGGKFSGRIESGNAISCERDNLPDASRARRRPQHSA